MKKLCTLNPLVALLPLVAFAGACEVAKSADPLSPTVAGPIPGVNITAPKVLEPTPGQQIAVDRQPVTLLIENASSNGPRPLSYVFEVATDANYSSKVFAREAIQPGEGGRTSLRLPDALATGRTYYWRARAEDGANTGPYTGTAHFNVFTPIVIDTPLPNSPAMNSTVTTVKPSLVVGNAARSGPVGPLAYTFDVATDYPFTAKVGTWTVDEQAGQTKLELPVDLKYSSVYYWRVRAGDSTTTGPWSQVFAFATAQEPITPPSGGGGGPVGDWRSCGSTPGEAVVRCVHAAVNPSHTPESAFEVTKRVAWLLRSSGAGLLIKNGGENVVSWQGRSFSASRICYPDGHIYKVLSDVPATNGPAWQDNDYVDRSLYVPAIDPGQ